MVDSHCMLTNYRRNFFIALIVIVFLLATDTSAEQGARRFFLTSFGLDVGGDVSIVGLLDTLRMTASGQINSLSRYVISEAEGATGIVYMIWYSAKLVISVLQTIASNLYLFYAVLTALIYFMLTSRLFKNHYDY